MLIGMSDDDDDDLLSAGIEALRAGKKREARRLFADLVHEQPENAAAWWYLAGVVDDPEQKAYCLRQVIALQPDHQEARTLLAGVERRVARPTPARGTPRPVYDAQEADGSLVVSAQPLDLEDEEVNSEGGRANNDITVMAAAVAVALLAIVGSVVLVSSDFGRDALGIRAPGDEPTPIPITFGVEACAPSGGPEATLVFINNTSLTVEILQGPDGEEALVLTLPPGGQQSVTARAGMTHYVVRTQSPGFAAGGAFFDVQAGSSCRVPIQ